MCVSSKGSTHILYVIDIQAIIFHAHIIDYPNLSDMNLLGGKVDHDYVCFVTMMAINKPVFLAVSRFY